MTNFFKSGLDLTNLDTSFMDLSRITSHNIKTVIKILPLIITTTANKRNEKFAMLQIQFQSFQFDRIGWHLIVYFALPMIGSNNWIQYRPMRWMRLDPIIGPCIFSFSFQIEWKLFIKKFFLIINKLAWKQDKLPCGLYRHELSTY